MSELVVGAGITGTTMARLLAESGLNVHVIDKKGHIAGNCYDYRDENGIMIHKYGSHIFHTSNKKVWNFITRFTDFNMYMHKVIAIIDGIETTIPFNFNTLHDVFPNELANRLEKKLLDKFEYNKKVPILEFQKQEDNDLKFLSQYIYEKIFLHYTMKQWGYSPEEIDSAVTARVPVYISKDNRYFQDTYQGIPLNGYTETIKKMLNHENITVDLQTDFKDIDKNKYNRIFYTGPIDEYLNYIFGPLPYRSVYFKMETFDSEHVLPNAVVNYPCNYDFTRVHEYKYYLNDKSNKTVIAKEYSEPFKLNENERYYPIPGVENTKLYNKYLEKAMESHDNIYFLGRLGDYKYYNMDQAILRAIDLYESL